MMRCFAFVYIWVFTQSIFSQSILSNTIGLPQVINYNKNQYQGGGQIWDIKQDSSGILYFGNNEGLLTLNGGQWQCYKLPNKTIVRSIGIDKNQKIFVGGQNEFGYFYPNQNGILTYYSLINLLPSQHKNFEDVWDVEISSEGVFFRTLKKIFLYKNNTIKVFEPQSQWVYLTISNNTLFAQDYQNGIYIFYQNKWQKFIDNDLFHANLVNGIFLFNNQKWIISTLKNGFYVFENQKIKPLNSSYLNNNIKKEVIVSTALPLNASQFILGTNAKGINIIDEKGELIQKISKDEGLQNNDVLCMFVDKNKNIWVGLNNGISFIPYNLPIRYIKPLINNNMGGYSAIVFDNHLYLAMSNGVYSLPLQHTQSDISAVKGHFQEIQNTKGQVWQLSKIHNKLLVNHQDGAFLIQNNIAKPLFTEYGTWLFAPPQTTNQSEKIFIGTYKGLHEIQFQHGNQYTYQKNNIVAESFRFVCVDADTTIWASHPYIGIYKINFDKKNNQYQYQLFTKENGLPSHLDNYVFKINNKVIFSTIDGIYEFNAKTHFFELSSTLSHIFKGLNIQYLKEDNQQNIWFATKNKIGIAKHDTLSKTTQYKIIFFPELSTKMLPNFHNIYPYNSKNVFIGGENDVIHLNLDQYLSRAIQVNVMLAKVKAIIRGKDSTIFEGYAFPNNVSQEFKKNIPVFANEIKSFHFEFGSSNYEINDNIEYAYQLVGFDKQWSEWSKKNEKDYTNLPSQNYTFQVKSRDNIGNESTLVKYQFIILPPWYLQWWAWLVYSIIFIFFNFFLIKWLNNKFQNQRQKFIEHQKRIKYIHSLEIEKKEQETVKLKNLNLETEIQFKNKELATISMHLIERNDVLKKMKDELYKIYKKTDKNPEVQSAIELFKTFEYKEENWEIFSSHFDEINNNFLKNIKNKFPTLSKTDLKLCAYLKLNLSTKEIAQLLNISIRGVEISRYRLRKKLNISTNENLSEFLNYKTLS